jgi:hypothetical protein
MKLMILVFLCIINFVACTSKNTIDFKVLFQPNSVYVITTEQKAKTEIIPQKNNQAVDQNGVENGSVIETTRKQSSSITTGSVNPDQSFSWEMNFDSLTSTKVVDGKPVNMINPLKGLVIEGTCDKNNKIHIDSLLFNAFDVNIREELKASSEKIFEQMSFPSAQMNIGDEVIHHTPVEWPSRNSGTIKFHMSTKFKLVAIKDDIAFFEVIQNLDSINTKENYIHGNGQGTGNCEYDFKKNYIAKYQTSSNTDLTLTLFGEVTKCKINSSYFQQTILKD